MTRFIFGFLPWWVFAFLAFSFAPLSVGLYESYASQKNTVAKALQIGPPPVTPLRAFNLNRSVGPLDEVQLEGGLRADLGIIDVTFGDTSYAYVVVDDASQGPLVAVISKADQAQDAITNLINLAEPSGQVVVNGFLAPSRVRTVTAQLATRGERARSVLVVEPYFGARDAALLARVEDARWMFLISAGITALFALLAVVRFRRWRKRRAVRLSQRNTPPKPTVPQTLQPAAAAPAASPWGGAAPKPAAPDQGAPKVATKANVAARPNPAKHATKTRRSDPPPPPLEIPEFKSVFPGGGSGFRFKSADDIIRQSFGTATVITKVNRTDD